MPTLDALDYERFSYDEASVPPLALEEAVKKASELRKGDSANFYRIEPADVTGMGFRIQKVPVASVYAEFVSRFMRRFVRNGLSRKA
jgi:hypothetical protein